MVGTSSLSFTYNVHNIGHTHIDTIIVHVNIGSGIEMIFPDLIVSAGNRRFHVLISHEF